MSLDVSEPEQQSRQIPASRLRRPRGPFTPVWVMTALLFAASPLIAPGSLSGSALNSMFPFAAVLAVAALGQAFVVSQGGIDLSVPGAMALAAVFVTKVPELAGIPVPIAAALGLLVGAAGGLVTGIAVVRFGIAAFVVTLAMNAILIGVVLQVSGGFPGSADPSLSGFATGSVWVVPNLLIIAVVLVVATQWLRRRSVLGRRFMAAGANSAAARLLGIRTGAYQVSAYAAAGALYAVAGLLLAGYLRTPDILLGNTYQLSSIAAVVLGGSVLTGGMSNALATGVAALFLTQLNQVVLAAGATTSIQLLVQAVVLAVAVVLRRLPLTGVLRRLGVPRSR
ncbi:Ribose import permease protein RbsC [Micromonospora sp. MH33]|uniref:ABC transporter permease n=1 Tax=Micromonospora sp. MH33 TaxID=1945509 RepID=UPI000D294811|nr:ABC transporter permease [Micromonospora sp. MH33]PSK67693.1 Ribose import permease protein RbsC [Micromonospora sp. MH33]